jgi:prepilin-type N-terminal cleavage/methylation domain-containing protein
MNKKGITLMELIIVVLIIAIGAVLMVPNIAAWLPNYRLRSATRDIVSTMRVAQMKAVSTNLVYRVYFNDPLNTYILQRQTSAGSVAFNEEVDPQTLPTGVTFSSISFMGNVAVFNPNSTASSGNVVLKNPKESKKKISLLSTTGRVSVE